MELKTIIILLVTLIVVFTFLDVVKTGNATSDISLEIDSAPEWEKYELDEEGNKDRLYCRVTEDEHGNVIETRWYNSFINPGEIVRVDDGDTTIPNCEYPKHEPVYAVGSNEGKIYSRTLKDIKGIIIETMWYDACSHGLLKTDKGDTTYAGSNEFSGKCYHPDYTIDNSEEVVGDGEEELEKNPLYTLGERTINWFKSLFNM